MSIEKLQPLRAWIQKTMPMVYDDSLSLYELLNKVVEQVKEMGLKTNDMIDIINSLDGVQEAHVIKVLDDWYASGKLATIINNDVFNMKENKAFNTVSELKNSTSLKVGDFSRTLGYYSPNDGGQSQYFVVDDTNLVDNGGSVLSLTNGLFAKLMIQNKTVNVKQFGAYGDGNHNDDVAIQKTIDDVATYNGKVIVPSGVYPVTKSIKFSSWAGKKCSFVMEKGSKFVAVSLMDYLIDLSSTDTMEIENCDFVFDQLDGLSFATFLIRQRGVSDCNISVGILQNGTTSYVSDMTGTPNYGNFNNIIKINKIVTPANYGFYCLGNNGSKFTDFQGNFVQIMQTIKCGSTGIRLNDSLSNRTWYNTFELGAVEENGGYGIYLNSGKNTFRVNSTNNNVYGGLGGANGLESNTIMGYFEDKIDSNQIIGHNVLTHYPKVRNGGLAMGIPNGGTIVHGLAYAPSKISVSCKNTGMIISVFSVNSTTITVGIQGHDGSNPPSEDIWWMAEV